MKSTRSLRFGNPLLSLIRRASSLHLTCSAMGSFPDIFAKFVMFISGRAFIDLKVSYNVLDRSANFRNPGPSLLDMFGPSTKASTHAFATTCGCPKRCCSIFRALDSPPGTPSNPATALLAWPSRNCKRRDIFWVSEMFWVPTISSKRALNRKYSHGLPENLTTSKGGRLDLVTIESILAVSFVTIVSVVLAREDTLPGWQSWLDGNAAFTNGDAAGFKPDPLTWNFGTTVSPGVELNNGLPLGAGTSATGADKTDLSSFSVVLWSIISSIFVESSNSSEFRYSISLPLGLSSHVMSCMLFALLTGLGEASSSSS